MKCSISQKGEYDYSVVASSLLQSLKGEPVYGAKFKPLADARHAILKYIGLSYNRKRRYSQFNHKAPPEYEQAAA